VSDVLDATLGTEWMRITTEEIAKWLDPAVLARLGPSQEARPRQSRVHGFARTRRLDAAEGVLRALSLTHGFAPIVLLAGHGSSTVNNPLAAGLDCGACGGHTGEGNGRVAASVLNDPTARERLVARGIVIPAGTRLLAGLHDTTTDEVTLYRADLNDPAIAQLRGWLHLFSLGAGALGGAQPGRGFKHGGVAGPIGNRVMARGAYHPWRCAARSMLMMPEKSEPAPPSLAKRS
jgi:hypothetical protein